MRLCRYSLHAYRPALGMCHEASRTTGGLDDWRSSRSSAGARSDTGLVDRARRETEVAMSGELRRAVRAKSMVCAVEGGRTRRPHHQLVQLLIGGRSLDPLDMIEPHDALDPATSSIRKTT